MFPYIFRYTSRFCGSRYTAPGSATSLVGVEVLQGQRPGQDVHRLRNAVAFEPVGSVLLAKSVSCTCHFSLPVFWSSAMPRPSTVPMKTMP